MNNLIGKKVSGPLRSDMYEEGDHAYENKSVDGFGPSTIRAFPEDPWNRINMLHSNALSLSEVGKRVSNSGTRSLSTLGSISGKSWLWKSACRFTIDGKIHKNHLHGILHKF